MVKVLKHKDSEEGVLSLICQWVRQGQYWAHSFYAAVSSPLPGLTVIHTATVSINFKVANIGMSSHVQLDFAV